MKIILFVIFSFMYFVILSSFVYGDGELPEPFGGFLFLFGLYSYIAFLAIRSNARKRRKVEDNTSIQKSNDVQKNNSSLEDIIASMFSFVLGLSSLLISYKPLYSEVTENYFSKFWFVTGLFFLFGSIYLFKKHLKNR